MSTHVPPSGMRTESNGRWRPRHALGAGRHFAQYPPDTIAAHVEGDHAPVAGVDHGKLAIGDRGELVRIVHVRRTRHAEHAPRKIRDHDAMPGIVRDVVARRVLVDVQFRGIQRQDLLSRCALQRDLYALAGSGRRHATVEGGLVRIGHDESAVAMHLEIRRTRVHAEGVQVDRLDAHPVGAEHVDLSVAEEIEAAVRRGESAAGTDGAEDPLARIDHKGEACRERREGEDGDRGALNA